MRSITEVRNESGALVGEVMYTRHASKWWWRPVGAEKWRGLSSAAGKADAIARVLNYAQEL